MKRTIFPVLVVFLVSSIAVAVTRLLSNHGPGQSGPARSAAKSLTNRTNAVNYKGVSFTFDPSLASDVTSETIPREVEDPTNILPEHPAFTLVSSPRPKELEAGDAHIRVFPIVNFRETVAEASRKYFEQVEDPRDPIDWTVDFDEEVRTLKTLIAERPDRGNVKAVIARARHGKNCSNMPFLPMWERCQAFTAQLRFVNFKNGAGIVFLTQWDRETTQVSNEGLEYVFQGITDDGQHYVSAEFSVAAPCLPKGDEPEVMAWNEKNYLLPHRSKRYQSYLRPVLAKLEALPANKFQPNLELIEEFIQSLEIQKQ